MYTWLDYVFRCVQLLLDLVYWFWLWFCLIFGKCSVLNGYYIKKIYSFFIISLPLFIFSYARCEQPVNCKWGPYGDWSECDGCTKTQV